MQKPGIVQDLVLLVDIDGLNKLLMKKKTGEDPDVKYFILS